MTFSSLSLDLAVRVSRVQPSAPAAEAALTLPLEPVQGSPQSCQEKPSSIKPKTVDIMFPRSNIAILGGTFNYLDQTNRTSKGV